MNRKNIAIVVFCYVLWGLLPLYWAIFSPVDSFFVLANRVVWSLVFCSAILLLQGRFREIFRALRDRKTMRFMVPATVFITINWGIYIWAVGRGFVLECSLGYYLNPLMVLLCSVVFFKEKCSKAVWAAFAIAFLGVLYRIVRYGSVPWLALILGASFALYGACKKAARMDPVVSIGLETLIALPFALAYILYLACTGAPIYAVLPGEFALLVLAGVLTAVPLILYAQGMNNVPMIMMGFFQYIAPTISFLSGIFILGETLDPAMLVMLVCILVALAIYSWDTVQRHRASKRKRALK